MDSWNRGDAEVTAVSARYLRRGDPDAGFVYLGAVDEVAHLVGSATPDYRDAIALADKRIGVLLDAIRARPTYGAGALDGDRDHRSRPAGLQLPQHGQPRRPQRAGAHLVRVRGRPGYRRRRTAVPGVVDIAPTVVHQLGLTVDPAWNLDGRSFVTAGPPPPRPAARVRVRSRRPALELAVEAAKGAPALGAVRLRLPRGLTLQTRRPRACERAPRRSRTGQGGPARAGDHAARRRQKGAGARAPAAAAAQAPALAPASVTEAGDMALERRIAVTRRR